MAATSVNELATSLTIIAAVMPGCMVRIGDGTMVVTAGARTPDEITRDDPNAIHPGRVPTIAGTPFGWHPVDPARPNGGYHWWARFHC